MYLLAAATEFELEPARKILGNRKDVSFLVTGVGPVETAFTLTLFLSRNNNTTSVINFGAAGAYLHGGLNLLDICLARKEVLADLGICLGDKILSFSGNISVEQDFDLENDFFIKALKILKDESRPVHTGTFLTVNCASGTSARGNHLQETHQAICENMEGAAMARVCRGFGLQCLEVRCISNMVEDRDVSKWRLKEACDLAGKTAAGIVEGVIR